MTHPYILQFYDYKGAGNAFEEALEIARTGAP
jgi:hypothetical protein